ncbi:MAG TPA: plastocyanin/azurin family copper-binding protein [Actinomycetota bacterium]|nr:plastocyanin/azurin family copper-binding protein [Actinomycetota bacterium]
MSRARVAILAATLASAALPLSGVATAQEAVTHQVVTVGNLYVPGDRSQAALPPQVIFQGDSLDHTNLDAAEHDLVADGFGPDGRPWFDSELIGAGETASVPVENLKPGLYTYTCSIHPFMHGALQVEPAPGGSPQEPSNERLVVSGDNFFDPQTVTVPVGTTVRWRNDGQIAHSVTAADGSFDSSPGCPSAGCWGPGQEFTHTFTSPGTVPYYCKLHGTPQGSGHAGTVVVVDPMTQPTTVDSLSASRGPTAISVSGSASFGGQPPTLLNQDPAGDGPVAADLADDTGVDLLSAHAYQPDPNRGELIFEWKLTGLPASGSLPEAIRYTIPFKIGSNQYQIQAKLTNNASLTLVDDPAGHVANSGKAFQLRGNCTTNWNGTGSANCPHISWLSGQFDAANKTVRVRVPLGITPDFAPGKALVRNDSSNAGLNLISASYQAVVTLAGTTGDEMTFGSDELESFSYAIPSKQVRLGIAPAGTDPASVAYTGSATVGQNGAFTGTLPIAGLAAGSYDVYAEACFAAKCAVRSVRVTI